jgi:hypothetical protein
VSSRPPRALFDFPIEPDPIEEEPSAPERNGKPSPATNGTAPAVHGPDRLTVPLPVASGEKAKARDILAAIRILKWIERDQRAATHAEREALARFSGSGQWR